MANGANYALRAACECGTCVIEAEPIPTVRFNCHCTICQSYDLPIVYRKGPLGRHDPSGIARRDQK